MSEAFERDAARFYAETGMLVPGKDEAICASCHELLDRQRAWHAWCLREAERRTDDEALR